MPGLIPLVLQPSPAAVNRSSMVFSKPPVQRHTRHASTGSTPLVNFQPSSAKSRAMKHISQPVLPHLPVLPYTPAEWKRTMAEVKRQHAAKRFRACSARCVEILDNIRDTSNIEPVHMIYLHFYAASSLEMCARPFPTAAPARTQLLNQARKHYDQAAALINSAEESIVTKTRSRSGSSLSLSPGGALHSPSGSVSSGTWSTPTTATSPTNSVCSFDDLVAKRNHSRPPSAQTVRKAKKTVSFSLPKEETFKFPEPYIRPDSPTLGFEDSYFVAPITRKELPELPRSQPETPEPAEEDTHRRGEQSPCLSDRHSLFQDDLATRRVARYCETLSSLKDQLAAHSSSLNALLEEPSKREKTEHLSSTASTAAAREELRTLERRARIERLRQSGWTRKRFDASRYENLCNNVMAELT